MAADNGHQSDDRLGTNGRDGGRSDVMHRNDRLANCSGQTRRFLPRIVCPEGVVLVQFHRDGRRHCRERRSLKRPRWLAASSSPESDHWGNDSCYHRPFPVSPVGKSKWIPCPSWPDLHFAAACFAGSASSEYNPANRHGAVVDFGRIVMRILFSGMLLAVVTTAFVMTPGSAWA